MVIQEIETEEELQQKLVNRTKKYILIDIYATWCKPCMEFMPTLIEYSNKYNENIEYIKVNIAKPELKEIEKKYKIEQLPTFIIAGETDILDLQRNRIVGGSEETKKILEERLKKLEERLKILEGGGIKILEDF